MARQVIDVLAEREDNEYNQDLHDLADVVNSAHGYRLMRRLLIDLGVGCALSSEAAQVALYNFGQSLLDSIAQASPNAAARLAADLYVSGAKDA